MWNGHGYSGSQYSDKCFSYIRPTSPDHIGCLCRIIHATSVVLTGVSKAVRLIASCSGGVNIVNA